MPELPDVETFRRYLDATALHQRLVDVRVRSRRLLTGVSARRLQQALKGARFEVTGRHGKYLFAHTDRDAVLVLHFGMTGYLEYEKDRRPGAHDRVLFDFDNGYTLAYVCQRLLGKVALTKSVADFVEMNHLGPDALRVDRDDFAALLAGSRAAVKSCLMNQGLIAGIGNIYSDEVLFHSRLAPLRKGGALSAREAGQLYRWMRRVLNKAVEHQADPTRMPSSWLLPHRDEGGSCPRCGGKIQRTKVGGRSALWCPACQQR
jgi:formamidopyrimidine-DNA glycosylase